MSGAVPFAVVRFCAEEVGRQYDHPYAAPKRAAEAVADMVDAWMFATAKRKRRAKLTVELIKEIGGRIEPVKNLNGYRTVGVRVGERVCPPPQEVPDRMKRYVERLPDMKPDEAYLEFEEIHPFRDGNGRAGKVIFNWLLGAMDAPVMPPNFWGISNP